MSATRRQDDAFRDYVIDSDLLNNAITWISGNLNPEDVFNEKDLKEWALNNGYEEPK